MVHQEELRETRELLRQVIDTVPASICATDRDGKVLFANAMAAKRVGLTPEEAVGSGAVAIWNQTMRSCMSYSTVSSSKGFGFEPHL